MAYYLKKTKLKGRTYLSIDESFYNHDRRGTAHRCYKSLGSVETWKSKGIDDPISHFQKEVDALNQERNDAGTRKISDKSPAFFLEIMPFQTNFCDISASIMIFAEILRKYFVEISKESCYNEDNQKESRMTHERKGTS